MFKSTPAYIYMNNEQQGTGVKENKGEKENYIFGGQEHYGCGWGTKREPEKPSNSNKNIGFDKTYKVEKEKNYITKKK